MKVKAKELGYYRLKRQYPGATFHLKDEKDFSEKWMEKVDSEKVSTVKAKPAPKAKPSNDKEVI